MYKNYVFDLYGTLIDLTTDEDSDELWSKMSMFYSFYGAHYDAYDLKQKYEKYSKKMLQMVGDPDEVDINIEDVFYQLFKKKNVKPKKKVVGEAARTFRLLSIKEFKLHPHVLKVLEELKSKHKKLYIFSNAQECFTRSELTALGIADLFEEVYTSSELGKKKPSKDAYKAMLNASKLEAKKTVIIGDCWKEDVIGANKVNMDSIYIEKRKESIKDKHSAKHIISSGDLREILSLTL